MTTAIPGEVTREIILQPNTYCYVQAINTGKVSTRVGPTAFTLTQQEQLVAYDPQTDTFSKTDQNRAIRQTARVAEGDYVVLENPSDDKNVQFPKEASTADSHPPLSHGRRINIPGPANFALWPSQRAKTIKGHQLRLNQYLIVRIYNSEQAIQNWLKASIAPTKPSGDSTDPNKNASQNKNASAEAEEKKIPSILSSDPQSLGLVNGKTLIIKGTDTSFYIPPTGVEVIPEESEGDAKNYIRNAVTLERLEYCILVDENGNKRYEHGPAVIFPEPTERFMEDKDENGSKTRKFKAIELNKIQGIHVKVIADYTEDDGKTQRHVGDEMFLTGKDSAIYYPRKEHSIIRYGDRTKHFATAIPAGEGRYVMDRTTGEIRTVAGPEMLLPNPINEVIVRRILSAKEVALLYPGNNEAADYNRNLAAAAGVAGTSNANFVDDTSYRSKGMSSVSSEGFAMASLRSFENAPASPNIAGDSFNRGTNYTKPRTLTLDSKYDGVPQIGVWTGYAVMVVNKRGGRKVVEGPNNILLDYDETLERFALSTGKPKTADKLHEDVYLCVHNNKVSDIVEVETNDHVKLGIKISLVVNFEGEPEKWFSVNNYVKLLCDHVRSVLKGSIQQQKIEEFYGNSVAIIRDSILGKQDAKGERTGMVFEQNGMVVRDVEVLSVTIPDSRIASMLQESQQEVVQTNIAIHNAKRQLEATKLRESIQRDSATAKAETNKHEKELEAQRIAQDLSLSLARINSEISQTQERMKNVEANEAVAKIQMTEKLAREKAASDQHIAIEKENQALKLETIKAETESVVERFKAFDGQLSEALIVLGRDETMTKIAEATSLQTMLGGKNVVEALSGVLGGTAIGERIKKTIGPVTHRTDSVAR